MHNDFSKAAFNGDDKLDFSGLERLAPREDSWSKICARLDAETAGKSSPKDGTPANTTFRAETKGKILPFRLLSAIPLAASLVLVGISVMLTAFNNVESSPISMNNAASTELASWYGNLGQDNFDDYETLDKSITISYLMKE